VTSSPTRSMATLAFESLSTRELVVTLVLLVLFGAGVAILLLGPRNELKGRGGNQDLPIKSLGTKPIQQIELARNEADLRLILLKGNARQNVTDARAGNIFDTFLFIPTYTAALLLMALLVARGGVRDQRELFWIMVILVAVIAVTDWSENAGIERTLNHIDSGRGIQADDANYISYPSMVKWTVIGLVLFALGIAAIVKPPLAMRLFGILLLVLGTAQLYQMVMYFRERFTPS